jgi:hypothetical protein
VPPSALIVLRFTERALITSVSTQKGNVTECDDDCVRVIVSKDFAEVSACFCHRPGPRLAEPDTVAVADSAQNGLPAFFPHDEVIARDGAPA